MVGASLYQVRAGLSTRLRADRAIFHILVCGAGCLGVGLSVCLPVYLSTRLPAVRPSRIKRALYPFLQCRKLIIGHARVFVVNLIHRQLK